MNETDDARDEDPPVEAPGEAENLELGARAVQRADDEKDADQRARASSRSAFTSSRMNRTASTQKRGWIRKRATMPPAGAFGMAIPRKPAE